jgi:hypothetical protein
MPNALGTILGSGMLVAVPTPPPVCLPLPVRVLEQPSVINGGPLLHAVPVPMSGCSKYTVSVRETDYGQVRGKPSLSGRPLWRLVNGSNVTICSKDITTDERNIPWIWVQFKSQEEPWDHEGYMSFRILQPFVPPPVNVAPPPAAVIVPPAPSPTQQTQQTQEAPAVQVQPRTEESTTSHPDQKTLPEPEQKATPKVFGKDDLPFIHSEYKANEARWFKEFKGRFFEATLTIAHVTEALVGGGFNVSFMENPNDYFPGVDCAEVPSSDFLLSKNAGDSVHVRGTIVDHSFGSVTLHDCQLSDAK